MTYEDDYEDDDGFYELKLRPRSDLEIITYEETLSLEAWAAPRIAAIKELERERLTNEIKEIEEEEARYKKQMKKAEEDFENECFRDLIAIEDLMKNEGLSCDEATAKYYNL